MKKLIAFILSISMAPLWADTTPTADPEPIEIDSAVLKFIDGTPLIKINLMVFFVRLLHKLQYEGKIQYNNKTFELMHNGVCCPLKKLVELEKQQSNVSLKASLDQALEIFNEVSSPYLSEVEEAKEYMIVLIKQWSVQRNCPDSLLLNWSQVSGNEHEAFKAQVTTLAQLDRFVDDLRIFLKDLMKTCKISWKKYIKALEEKMKQQQQCSSEK